MDRDTLTLIPGDAGPQSDVMWRWADRLSNSVRAVGKGYERYSINILELKSMSKVVARIARSIISIFLNKFMFSQLGSIPVVKRYILH